MYFWLSFFQLLLVIFLFLSFSSACVTDHTRESCWVLFQRSSVQLVCSDLQTDFHKLLVLAREKEVWNLLSAWCDGRARGAIESEQQSVRQAAPKISVLASKQSASARAHTSRRRRRRRLRRLLLLLLPVFLLRCLGQ